MDTNNKIQILDGDDFFKVFNKMELEKNLLSLDIDGNCIWQIARPVLFDYIQSKVLNVGPSGTETSLNSKVDRIVNYLKKVLIVSKHSVLNDKKQCDTIVFKHQRRLKVDGKLVEVNTAYLDKIVDEVKTKTEFIDVNVDETNKAIEDNFKILCPGLFDTFFAYINPSIDKQVKHVSSLINKYTKEYFDVDIDVTKKLKLEYIRFITYNKVAYKYLKNKKPKQIYIVVSYCFQGIVKAAKDLGILVKEIQHGFIFNLHAGYSYPGVESLPYFTDKFLLYGEFWKNAAPMPIAKENLEVIGNPYYEIQINKYNNIEKENNSLLFVSSEKFGKELSKLAYEFAINNKEYKIYYKLHPHEFSTWKDDYPQLQNINNIEVVTSNINIYELFARCNYIVAVASTAIYESLYFKPKIILFNHSEIKRMQELTDLYKLPVINNNNELQYLIKNKMNWLIIERDLFYKNIIRKDK